MKFLLEPDPQPEQPVKITLTMDQYNGCKLPTLRANGISLLHILDDGRIVIRDEKTTNLIKLVDLGFPIVTTAIYNPRNSERIGILETIAASNLPYPMPDAVS